MLTSIINTGRFLGITSAFFNGHHQGNKQTNASDVYNLSIIYLTFAMGIYMLSEDGNYGFFNLAAEMLFSAAIGTASNILIPQEFSAPGHI